MKALFALPALFLATAAHAQAPSPAQMGITSTTTPEVLQTLDSSKTWVPLGTVNPTNHTFSSMGREINLASFGAKCDGVTNDDAAIQAWAAAAVNNVRMVVPGVCAFSTPIVFPLLVNYVTLDGGTLLYIGAATNVTPVTIGETEHARCSNFGWRVNNLRVKSNTVMTAGDSLFVGGACHMVFTNLSVGDAGPGTPWGDDNGNWYNGLHVQGGNTIVVRGMFGRGSHTAMLVNGNLCCALIDFFASDVVFTKSGMGVNIAGGVGGLVINSGDIVGNGANVRISQDVIASPNRQVMFGPNLAIDGTNTTDFPAASQIGVDLADAGPASPANSYLMIQGTWLSFASSDCLKVESNVKQYKLIMSGGTVITCGGNGFTNLSTDPGMVFQFSGTRFGANTNLDISNVAGATAVATQAVTYDAGSGKVVGDFAGTVVGPDNVARLRSSKSVVVTSQTSNIALNAEATHSIILGPGSTANCGLWVEDGTTIPGHSDGNTAGCTTSNLGTSTFPFSSVTATTYRSGSLAGFSGTKTAGTCVMTITGGIITNVTGC